MQFRSVGWARPTPRAMRKLNTYAFVGAVANGLLPLVVSHHSIMTQRVARSGRDHILRWRNSADSFPAMIHDGRGPKKRW